jgi:hypothetical protein
MQLDRASQFTLEYMRTLQEILHLEQGREGRSSAGITQVSTSALRRLRSELGAFLSGRAAQDARTDSSEYGTRFIQTVGFGLVLPKYFDRFVKMGFLCGSRLVIWDLIGTRLLRNVYDNPVQGKAIITVARNILSLRKVAEQGGLVILPHPADWSQNAKRELDKLYRGRRVDATSYGLVSALSVLKEIPLHPYTLLPMPENAWPTQPSFNDDRYYSGDHYVFHKVINDIFEDARFTFLEQVSVSDFYRISSKDQLF